MWAAGSLAVCCTVHLLLLTGGLAGIGAALGAATGNTALLAAVLVVAVATGVVIAWRRRRTRRPGCPPAPRESSDHESQ